MVPEFEQFKPMPSLEDIKECYSLFMSEINNGGIAMDFDLTPASWNDLIKYSIPRHLNKREQFSYLTNRFNRYTELIHNFSGIILLEEVFYDENITAVPDGFYAHEIKHETLTTYNLFSQSLEHYTDTLNAYSGGMTDFDVVLGAGLQLCKIARPGAWDPDASKDSLEDLTSHIRDTAPRTYLEFAIARATGQV